MDDIDTPKRRNNQKESLNNISPMYSPTRRQIYNRDLKKKKSRTENKTENIGKNFTENISKKNTNNDNHERRGFCGCCKKKNKVCAEGKGDNMDLKKSANREKVEVKLADGYCMPLELGQVRNDLKKMEISEYIGDDQKKVTESDEEEKKDC